MLRTKLIRVAVQLIDTSSPQVDGDRKSAEVQDFMPETEGAKKGSSYVESSGKSRG
jgi:hypothetical protein